MFVKPAPHIKILCALRLCSRRGIFMHAPVAQTMESIVLQVRTTHAGWLHNVDVVDVNFLIRVDVSDGNECGIAGS
jgi:hypothetical protein